MIVNEQNVTPTEPQNGEPKRVFNKEKAYDFIYKLNESNGGRLTESEVGTMARNPEMYWSTIYKKSNLAVPGQSELDSIYDTFFDIDETVEVKMPEVETEPQKKKSTESQPTSETTDSSSELPETPKAKDWDAYSEYEIPETYRAADPDAVEPKVGLTMGDKMFDETASVSEQIQNSNADFFNMNEEDAETQFNANYGRFGFKAKQTGFGQNMLKITAPNGQELEIQLFTDVYKRKAGWVGDEQYRENYHRNRIVNWLQENAASPLEGVYRALRSDIGGLLVQQIETDMNIGIRGVLDKEVIEQNSSGQLSKLIFGTGDMFFDYRNAQTVLEADIFALKRGLEKIKDKEVDFFMVDDTAFGRAQDYDQAEKSFGQKRTKRTMKKRINALEGQRDLLLSQKAMLSANIGNAFLNTGEYRSFDFGNNEEAVEILNAKGVSPVDLPIDQIRINGRAASYREVENIISDFTMLNDVRDGMVTIEIDEEYDFKSPTMKGLVGNLHALQVRNKAFFEGTNPKFADKTNSIAKFINKHEGLDYSVDFIQNLFISAGDAISNFNVFLSDGLQTLGVSKEMADNIVYAPSKVKRTKGGLPVYVHDAKNIYHPAVMKNMREEFLPFYSSDVSDVDTFAEMMSKGGDVLANSLPVSSLFMVNPVLGLTAVGTTAYGSELYRLEEEISRAGDMKSARDVMTYEEARMAEMDKTEARAHAMSLAATETAITRVFTYNFFKNAAAAKNFRGAKNEINATKLANSYGRSFYRSALRRYSDMLGMSPRAMMTEFTEEELITVSRMAIEQAWGLKNYTDQEIIDAMEATGVGSLFSSVGLAKMSSMGHKTKILSELDNVIGQNILIEGEASSVATYIGLEQKIAEEKAKETPDEGAIEQLEVQLQEQASVLKGIRNRKAELVNSFNMDDKKRIINLMADAESYKAAASRSENPYEYNAALIKIKESQQEMYSILKKYPSALTMKYLPREEQMRLKQAAADEIIAERFEGKSEAPKYEIRVEDPTGLPLPATIDEGMDITNEEITERALAKWAEETRNGGVENKEAITIMPGFDINPMEEYTPSFSAKEYQNYNLATEVQGAKTNFNEVAESGVVMELRESYTPEENDRIGNILDDLDYLANAGDYMSSLSYSQREIIMQFTKDVNAGKRPQLGKVESLIDASRLAIDIFSRTGEKIDIFGQGGSNAVMDALIKYSQRMYAGDVDLPVLKGRTLATTDILMETLFKDNKIGKPFYDLNMEAGRVTDATIQETDKVYREHLTSWETDAKADLEANGLKEGQRKDDVLNPNSLENSYEQYILGSLYRLSGETRKYGDTYIDNEFKRVQSLVLRELELRRSEAESNSYDSKEQKDAAIIRYRKWKEVVDRLGVATAKSYDDIFSNASNRNVSAVQRMAEMQPNQEALTRIKDYSRFDVKMMERYMPMFYKTNSETYSDAFGRTTDGLSDGKANQLKEATLPVGLEGNDLRLSPSQYFDQVYGSYRGLMLDINARGKYRTLSYLMDNPQFQLLFEGNTRRNDGSIQTTSEYETFATIFKNREKTFDKMVRSSHLNPKDIGEAEISLLNQLQSTAYTSWSAKSLVRLSQNFQQFQSAVSGASTILQTPEAKRYLGQKNMSFFTFTSNLNSGNESKGVGLSGLINEYTPYGRSYASNIYAKSRTGLRNTLDANLIIDPSKTYPLSYYADFYKIDEESMTRLSGLTGGDTKYRLNQVLKAIEKSSSFSLEVGLANGDLAAANATFESFYMDYRLRNGATIPEGGYKAFWEAENKDPNIEAINYADQMISRSQRQSTATAEADIYDKYASDQVKFLTRMLIPFSRFTYNVRSDIANQVSVINDPNISEEQKKEARNILSGKVREVASFSIIRTMSLEALLKGIGGMAGLVGVDDEDIERYSKYSITGLVGQTIPMEERDVMTPSEVPLRQDTENLEQTRIREEIFSTEYSNLTSSMQDVVDGAMIYSNKFKTSNYDPQVLRDFTQETIQTMVPLPRPSITDELFAYGMNIVAQEMNVDVEAREFVSSDVKSSQTLDGFKAVVLDNLGMGTIALESADRLITAADLLFNAKKTKYNPMSAEKTIDVGITAPTEAQRQQLENATLILFVGTLYNGIGPGPKGDFAKYLNRLERSIEEYYDAVGTIGGMPYGEYEMGSPADADVIPKADSRRSVLDEER